MMLEDAARLARAAGMRRLVLDTAVDNEKSQTLLSKSDPEDVGDT